MNHKVSENSTRNISVGPYKIQIKSLILPCKTHQQKIILDLKLIKFPFRIFVSFISNDSHSMLQTIFMLLMKRKTSPYTYFCYFCSVYKNKNKIKKISRALKETETEIGE